VPPGASGKRPNQSLQQTAGHVSFLGLIAHRCPAAAERGRSAVGEVLPMRSLLVLLSLVGFSFPAGPVAERGVRPSPVGLWAVPIRHGDNGLPEGFLLSPGPFYFDGETVVLRLHTRKSWMTRSPDDYYRVRSRWSGDTLEWLPPFGSWSPFGDIPGRGFRGRRPRGCLAVRAGAAGSGDEGSPPPGAAAEGTRLRDAAELTRRTRPPGSTPARSDGRRGRRTRRCTGPRRQ
jgi:hypothetical protein